MQDGEGIQDFHPFFCECVDFIMTAIWTDQMNCSALSLLPSKHSNLAALALLDKWLSVSIFFRIACAAADAALAAASEMSVRASMVQSSRALLAAWSWVSC